MTSQMKIFIHNNPKENEEKNDIRKSLVRLPEMFPIDYSTCQCVCVGTLQ
jgi:hypothetical protein